MNIKNWAIFIVLVCLLSLALVFADGHEKRKKSAIRTKPLKRLIQKVDKMYQRSLKILKKLNSLYHCSLESCKKRISRRNYSLQESYNRFLKRCVDEQEETLELINNSKDLFKEKSFRGFVKEFIKKGYKFIRKGLKGYHKACCAQNEPCCEKKTFSKLAKQFKYQDKKTRKLVRKLEKRTKRLLRRKKEEEAQRQQQQWINLMAASLFVKVKARHEEIQKELNRKNLMLFKQAILNNEKKVRDFIKKVPNKKMKKKLLKQLNLLKQRNKDQS